MDSHVLGLGEVHLWLASLQVTDATYAALLQSLSPDERCRAGKFAFEVPGRKFVVARGILRSILARYLAVEPADVHFDYGPHGKPCLDRALALQRLEFNLSHASDLFALALFTHGRIGVDVERVRSLPDLERMVHSACSDLERDALSDLDVEARTLGFFRCWTRKEAYIKACGDGLSIPLDTFDVSLAPDNPIAMLAHRRDPAEVSRWSFYTFNPEPGYIGAAAAEGQRVAYHLLRWGAT